jgi:DNA repair photolyase
MALNKSKGNMYPWVTHTWNPIKGCRHGCRYCYLKSLETQYGYDLSPRFVEADLRKNLGKGKVIFVGSASDMWGKWVSSESIGRVLDRCREFENTYVFQSKNPARFLEFTERFPKNVLLGTTIETDSYTKKITEAPGIEKRVVAMKKIQGRKFVSIEPILQFDLDRLMRMILEIRPSFVSIGADSKSHGLPEPEGKEVRELIKRLKEFTEVKVKWNLSRFLKDTSH